MFLGTPIDDAVGDLVMAQLLHLESEDAEKDISLYINSPGGDITSLFAIYDTMQYVKPQVSTICMGQAAAAAAVLLLAGAKGKRYALPPGTSLPTVFNAADPNDPSVVDADFAWSTIDGRVDSNGDGMIDGNECHFGIIGDADVLGSDPGCGFAVTRTRRSMAWWT